MDALQLAPGYGQIARPRGSAGQDDRVELAAQFVDRHVDADVRAGLEHDPFLGQQVDAPIEDALLELELGNAVAEQAADPVGALEDRDPVARQIELRRCGEASRSRPDDGHPFAGADDRRTRRDPPFIEGAIDDRHFDRFDRHRIAIDAEHAGAFAGRRAQPSRELGEVVGRVQALDRRLPSIAIDQVVPVRDQVAERAAAVAERNAAVHAA